MIMFEKMIPSRNGRKETLHAKIPLRRQGERLGRISFFQCFKNIHEKNRDIGCMGAILAWKKMTAKEPFATQKDPHEDISNKAVIKSPNFVACKERAPKGDAAVDSEKEAPNQGHLSCISDSFGGQIRILQSGQALDRRLLWKKACRKKTQ